MLIVELPSLPAVSVLNGPTFESVLHSSFVYFSGPKRRFSQSQRQVSSMFNRTGRDTIGKHLKTAQKKGYILKVRDTSGANPDEYVRGAFFSHETPESRALITLATSLWGTQGLLRNWPYPTAWGHGCLPPAVILAMATLSGLDESISKKSLRRYLSPLVKESSFNSAMQYLVTHHLVYTDAGRLLIAPDWQIKIEAILDAKPACNERQDKGDRRRRLESEKNRMRLANSELTDAERQQILKLPCVVKGCRRKAKEVEHFPPRHLLKDLEVSTNRHFVWAICWKHNHQMQAFIKKLPNAKATPPHKIVFRKQGVDPLRIYSATANLQIIKFYEAYNRNDIDAATHAATMALGHWKAISQLPESLTTDFPKHTPSTRVRRGKKPYSPERSQLPYRPRKRSEN